MNGNDQQNFLQAVQQSIRTGAYYEFARTHEAQDNFAYSHFEPGFLPWHRAFLINFENMLRGQGPQFACVALPYWDWTRDAGNAGEGLRQIFNDDLGLGQLQTGCVRTGRFAQMLNWPDDTGCARTDPQYQVQLFGPLQQMSALQFGGFEMFLEALESGGHTMAHYRIGGDLSTGRSAGHPSFYFIHSNTDRIWALWQDCHNSEDGGSAGRDYPNNVDGPMPGLQYSVRDVWDYQQHGYSYESEAWWRQQVSVGQCNFDTMRIRQGIAADNNTVSEEILTAVQATSSVFDLEYSLSMDEDVAFAQAMRKECLTFDLSVNERAFKDFMTKMNHSNPDMAMISPCSAFMSKSKSTSSMGLPVPLPETEPLPVPIPDVQNKYANPAKITPDTNKTEPEAVLAPSAANAPTAADVNYL